MIEAWNYIKYISKDVDGYARNRLLNVMPETCSLLKSEPSLKHTYCKLDDSTEVALLYNEDTPIFEQLIKLIPTNEITRITVICPYYDEDGETLINLLAQFNNSTLDVYLPHDFGLPPVKLAPINSIRFFSWEETERGKMKINGTEVYKRKLHSKIFHFQSDKYEYCLIGSANATIKGFGSLYKKSTNEEFCALYRTNGTDLLRSFGIKGAKKRVSLIDYSRNANIESEERKIANKKSIHITSVDLNGSTLKIYFKIKAVFESTYLSIFDSEGKKNHNELVILSGQNVISIQLKSEILKLNLGYVLIEDIEGNPISNKQLINFIDKLINTDPTKGNRNIRQIISAIEGGFINEFEIIEYINNLQKKDNDQSFKLGSNHLANNQAIGNNDVSASEMTYEEAVAAAKDSHNYENITKTHSSTRLWESISQLFKDKLTSVDDEIMDEEEQADAVKSQDRKIANVESQQIIIKDSEHFNKMIASALKMTENYKQTLNKFTNSIDHEIDIIDLSQFLLVTHVLTVVCNFTEYKFLKEKDAQKWDGHLSKLYAYSMMDILVDFTKLCIKFRFKEYENNEYKLNQQKEYIQKAIYHLWVYIHLIQRKLSEVIISKKIELVGLNLLHFLGKPDGDFKNYLNNMSKAYNDIYFNPANVLKFHETQLGIYNGLNLNDKFMALDHSGICKILEKRDNLIDYKSLFGKYQASTTTLKKNIIKLNLVDLP